MDLTPYMLYTREQAEGFRRRNADVVRARLRVYAAWIRNLPPLVWIPYLEHVDKGAYEVVIGLICLCYRDGLVNITFSPDYRWIRRDPDK